VEVDNVKLFGLKYLLYSGGQPGRYGNPANGTTGGNWSGFADGDEPVAKGRDGARGRGNDLYLMTHPGEIKLKTGNMITNTPGESEVIGRDQRYLHR